MKLKRLYAVTICINYADYLVETISNKRHFDAWYIITCQNDHATQELCRNHNGELIISELCGPRGELFNSAHAKAALINEALERLPMDGWVLLIDADVVLPRFFRQRLEAMELYPRAFYGLKGRKQCATWEEYDWRKHIEPWEEGLGVHPNILGYFQLFRLDQPHNRYPVNKVMPEMHDDIAFQYEFLPQLRKLLPMTCIHVGPPGLNWTGRRSETFRGKRTAEREPAPETAGRARLPSALAHRLQSTHILWVIGIDPTTEIAVLCRKAQRVYAIDWYGCFSRGCTPSVEVERRFARAMLNAMTRDIENLHIVREVEERQLVKQLIDNPPSIVFFNCELDIDSAIQWGRVFCAAAWYGAICGRYYGFPYWRATTIAINVLYGAPRAVYRDGTWCVSSNRKRDLVAMRQKKYCNKKPAHPLVMAIRGPGDVDNCIMHAMNAFKQTFVDVLVLDYLHDPAMAIIADILGVQVHSISQRSAGITVGAVTYTDLAFVNAVGIENVTFVDLRATCGSTLRGIAQNKKHSAAQVVYCGLAVKNLPKREQQQFAKETGRLIGKEMEVARLADVPIDATQLSISNGARLLQMWEGYVAMAVVMHLRWPLYSALAAACIEGGGGENESSAKPVLLANGATSKLLTELEESGNANRERIAAWKSVSMLLRRFRNGVHVYKDAVIVTWITPRTAGQLVQVVGSWRFKGHTAMQLVVPPDNDAATVEDVSKRLKARTTLVDKAFEGLWQKPVGTEQDCIATGILQMLNAIGDKRHFVFLPSNIYPCPGADLFSFAYYREAPFACEVVTRSVEGKGGNFHHSKRPVLAAPLLVEGSLLRRVLLKAMGSGKVRDWRVLLFQHCRDMPEAIFRPQSAMGWQILEET